jgi:thioredoxin reductase (NADPH)
MVENVIIIGSGPAGLSAAIYTAREELKPLLITGVPAGGQLLLTTKVENMPGFPDGIDGPELIDRMTTQAEKFGTRMISENAVDVDFSKKPYTVKTDTQSFDAHTVIIATGANAKLLGIPSEMDHMGVGVSTCATCDGAFFKGKDVVVVGGGDTAMEDSLFLTRFCASVTIVHRKKEFRASKIMQQKVLSNDKIKVVWNSTVEEIYGKDGVSGVTGVKIRDVDSKQTKVLVAQGVFIAIGHVPNTKFLNGKLKLDELGYVIATDEVVTEFPGVFVAGDNQDRHYRQAGTASAAGIKAALKAREFIQNMSK